MVLGMCLGMLAGCAVAEKIIRARTA